MRGVPGADTVTARVNVAVAVPIAFVDVIVYTVALCTVVGVPDNNPVVVLNDVPLGADGLIEKLTIAVPVGVIV
jgi:hypothetical protein